MKIERGLNRLWNQGVDVFAPVPVSIHNYPSSRFKVHRSRFTVEKSMNIS